MRYKEYQIGFAKKTILESARTLKSGVAATTLEEEQRGCVVLTPNKRGLLNMYKLRNKQNNEVHMNYDKIVKSLERSNLKWITI